MKLFKKKQKEKKKLRSQVVEILGDQLTEEEIEIFCIKHDISHNVAETVFLYLTNSKDKVAEILNVEGATVIRRLKRFIEKSTK